MCTLRTHRSLARGHGSRAAAAWGGSSLSFLVFRGKARAWRVIQATGFWGRCNGERPSPFHPHPHCWAFLSSNSTGTDWAQQLEHSCVIYFLPWTPTKVCKEKWLVSNAREISLSSGPDVAAPQLLLSLRLSFLLANLHALPSSCRIAVPCHQYFLLNSVYCGCRWPSLGKWKLIEDRDHEDLLRQRLVPLEMQGQKWAACTMIHCGLDSEGDFQNLTLTS